MSLKALEDMFSLVGIRRSGELRANDISHYTVERAIEAGIIRRPRMSKALGNIPGLFVSADAYADAMRDPAIAMILTKGRGVIHGETAGKLLRLTDGLPTAIELLYPWDQARLPRQVTYASHRTRNANLLDYEVEPVETEFGVPVRMTTPARTVVDLLHAGRRDATAYAEGMKALSRFLSDNGEAGELNRIAHVVRPESVGYIDALANAADAAMSSGGGRRYGT